MGYYISLQNYAYATGDSAPYRAESDSGCVGCKAITDFVKFANAANGGLTGDYADKLVSVRDMVRGDGGKLQGTAEIHSDAYMERPSPSASLVPRAAGNAELTFTLSTRGGNWIMYELEYKE